MSDQSPPPPRPWIEELIFIKIPYYVSGVLFLVAAGINIINVIGRYVFATPIFWAEEVLVFIVIWAVFLVAGTVTYRGAHLNMDLVYAGFRPAFRRAINVVILVTLIASCLYTATQSWKVVSLHYRTGNLTAATDIPLFIPHAALLFGFLFMAAAAIVRIPAYVTGDFGHRE